MTNEEAKKMLKAKLECLKDETSGINDDCNMRLCAGCSLNYEQGNMGEQIEALDMAIKALEQEPKTGKWLDASEGLIPYACSKCGAVEFKISKYCPKCGTKMEEP